MLKRLHLLYTKLRLSSNVLVLIHWGRVTHICVSNLTIIGSDNGLSPGRRQAITETYVGWNVVNWNIGYRLQWNFNMNSNIFIQENAFENVVCEIKDILSRPQCINHCLGLNKWHYTTLQQRTKKYLQQALLPFSARTSIEGSQQWPPVDNWTFQCSFIRRIMAKKLQLNE